MPSLIIGLSLWLRYKLYPFYIFCILYWAQIREKYLEEQEKVKKLEIELERLKITNSSTNKTMAGLIADITIKAFEGETIEEHTRIGDDIQARVD